MCTILGWGTTTTIPWYWPEVGDPLRIFPLDAEKFVTKTQANIPFQAL